MQPLPQIKEFSVERQLRQKRSQSPEGVSNDDIMAAIADLNRRIDSLSVAEAPAPEAAGKEANSDDVIAARIEIAAMVRVIAQAKYEIAAIRHPDSEDDRMIAATNELDAIVLATETSTEDILGASEKIELLVRELSGCHPNDEESATLAEDVASEIIKIFEACNFQDLTGQRITKVVRIIRFIEEKILAIINIWGVDAFTDLPIPAEPRAEGDAGLMNGPQLEGQGISQDDINALFD